ncbi:lytic murein transglycosylase [Aldersonia sp. NBC_00410]|uniref:lytic transglycosylase domain-containing protein n=1 Tax=Aldersonia sp. NBC_00410 TaxID=2975954 RepID=UPI00224D3C0D|nr:lytic murein transglycosylase [Aldersonia sp. NBC_00410]MCX5045505.1 lytic murein transglycosylase [Aldersonia sp. NBC_00410]
MVTSTIVTAGCAGFGDGIDVPEGIPPGPGAPLPPIDIDAPGRSATQLSAWATEQSDAHDIPVIALEAYGYAAAVLARSAPDCGIAWTTLAGIASVESKHGMHGRSTVLPDGRVDPPIRGAALDGSPGIAEIDDSDGGTLDGDTEHDRAIGPFQFIPETWRVWAADANGDGVLDPDNIDDAALTAARYLCARGGNLRTAEGWQNALMAYNQSGSYLREVRHRAALYSVGAELS